jgi:uncharacterized membrane protein
MRTILRALALSCLSLLAGSVLAGAQTKAPASSEGFQICNGSGQDVELATAVDLGDQGGTPGTYLSKGWYGFDNGQCFVMWPGTPQHRYFFVYAQNKQTGKEWKGDVPVCVSREPRAVRIERAELWSRQIQPSLRPHRHRQQRELDVQPPAVS